ncbi:MAG TPA: serine/threonine-protein kinase, partial [Pirellulaceae bacterium]|nr:serine/threonine-protein kinase [Pirellulaceae bacterium]
LSETGCRLESGSVIDGKYQLGEVIGQGGMGLVYRAEQISPIKRRVAIKVIRPGMSTRHVLARFDIERQALAMMDHPHIAKILDAGVVRSKEGEGSGAAHDKFGKPELDAYPYFVMEYVDGVPFVEYCENNKLPLDVRLRLFLMVCSALQHAHQKGLIHRDLKPTNILVTEQDGVSCPKVIDFGLAKAMDEPWDDRLTITQFGAVIGTPPYMAPEQMTGQVGSVDTRSDVFALGAVLYELLTGTTPLERERLRLANWDDVRRMVENEIPERPSARLARLALSASSRGAGTASRPVSSVPPDLDWIVLKCLEKQPDRRYATVNAVVRDVERLMAHEPIEARPPSAWYRARTVLWRYRGTAMAASLVFFALAAGLIVALWSLREARTAWLNESLQRQRAEGEAERANRESENARLAEQIAKQRADELHQVSEFQSSQLAGIDVPMMGQRLRDALLQGHRDGAARYGLPGDEVDRQHEQLLSLLSDVDFTGLALQSLDETIIRAGELAVDQQFHNQPLIQARLLQALVDVMRRLGLYARALEAEKRVLELRQSHLPVDDPRTVLAMVKLADLMVLQRDLTAAEELIDQAVHAALRAEGESSMLHALALDARAQLLRRQRQFADAERDWQQALLILRGVVGDDHFETVRMMHYLGVAYRDMGKLDQAEALLRETILIQRQNQYESRSIASTSNSLALVLMQQGKSDEAVECLLEAIEINAAGSGEDHPSTVSYHRNLAEIYQRLGQFADADPHYRRVWESKRKTLGALHDDTVRALEEYARNLFSLGRSEESIHSLQQALAAREKLRGWQHKPTLATCSNLAALLRLSGRLDEALELWRRAEPIARSCLEMRDGLRTAISEQYCLTLADTGHIAEALEFGAKWLDELRQLEPGDPMALRTALQSLVYGCERGHEANPDAGHDLAAEKWRSQLDDLDH